VSVSASDLSLSGFVREFLKWEEVERCIDGKRRCGMCHLIDGFGGEGEEFRP
jgi:hypothetical protein